LSNKVIFKDRDETLFLKIYADLDPDDIELYILKDGEYKKVDTTYEKIDDHFYKCVVNFDFTGRYYFKIVYQGKRVGGSVINIEEDFISKIYEMEYGSWKIKDNQMIFYDTKGNELARYDLYDRNNKKNEDSVYYRKKV